MAQTDYGFYTSWDATTATGVARWGGDIIEGGLCGITGSIGSLVAGRFGGQAIRNPLALVHALWDDLGVLDWTAGTVRVQFIARTIGGSDRMIYAVKTGATFVMSLWVLASGALEFRYGTFSSLSGSPVSGPTIAVDQWYDFEMGFVVHDTVGLWDVRQDGASIMSASGTDTRGAAFGGQFTRIDLENDAADFDDLLIRRGVSLTLDADDYVTDNIGNPRVSHLIANGQGTYNQWTGVPAVTDNVDNVDEAINDSTTTYLFGPGPSTTRTSWYYEDLPGSAVEVLDLYQTTTLARGVQGDHIQFLRIGGVDYDAPLTDNGNSIHTIHEYWGTPDRWSANPSTSGSWIVSQVNGLQGGIEHQSGALYASQAMLVVLWGAPGLPNSKRLHFRDEFDRRNREACRSFTGLGGASGEPSWDGVRTPQDSLLSMYQGDSQANLDLEFLSGTDKAQVGGTLTTIGHPRQGIYLDNQRWAVDIDVLDEGAKTFEAGAVVRHTDTTAPADWGGKGIHARNYTVAILFDGASTFTCEIRFHPGGGVTQTRIANAPAGAIVWGTEFELDVEIQNVAGSSGSRVAIGVKVDGSYLTFSSTVTGISVQAPWVVDDRTESISTGNGAGPWYYSAASSPTPQATFDNWRALTLSSIQLGGGGTGNDEDCSAYESVVMQNECTGKTGTLVVPQTWPVRLKPPQYRIQRHEVRTGHSVVRTTDRRARRTWEILCKIATTAEREALATFIDDHNGPELPFAWTTPVPYAETITAKFTRVPDLDTLQRLPFFEDFTVEVTEMFCPS